jgi:hypothetical protein
MMLKGKPRVLGGRSVSLPRSQETTCGLNLDKPMLSQQETSD